jgi:hypothetical protein
MRRQIVDLIIDSVCWIIILTPIVYVGYDFYITVFKVP